MNAMDGTRSATAAWRRVDGAWELRLERWMRHPPEHVWEALTTPEGLEAWLAEAVVAPMASGQMVLRFRQPAHDCFPDTAEMRTQTNQVLVWDPPNRFEHTFGHPDSIASWRLVSERGGTRLFLTHRVPPEWEPDLSRTLAGWHHHLEALSAALAGKPFEWSWTRWFSLRDLYARLIAEGGTNHSPTNGATEDDPNEADECSS